MRILLDLDDVLADFAGAAAKAHGYEVDHVKQLRRPGVWGDLAAYGCETNDQFWKPIHDHQYGEDFFWENIDPLPWYDELIELVTDTTSDWFIVTSPSRSPLSCSGKIAWCHKWVGTQFDRCIPTRHKYVLANPNTVLIDDRDSNCEEFREHGGNAITFPSIGNHLHGLKDKPVEYVRAMLLNMLGYKV